MSWSIRAEGTAEELRAVVHQHEREHWSHMGLVERLAVHHLVGHAIETAADAGRPGVRFVLDGAGHESAGGYVSHKIDLWPIPPAVVKES